jgi:MFS transporter, UMF1 family
MDRKKVWSWAFYDWANSAYSTTVMAGFFPVFFKNYWSAGTDPVTTTAKLGLTLSISSLIIALLSPTLGVLADLRGLKKIMCTFFMLIGAASCAWMSIIDYGDWTSAMLAYGLGMIAFSASTVFYDALLPSIVKDKDLDYASSLGYSLGYLGGGVLFAVNVVMYLKPEWFGISDGVQAVKISFFSVSIWWIIFTLPLLLNVPEPNSFHKKQSLSQALLSTIKNLQKTFVTILETPNLLIFILAFWLYIDGVYTVMTMAVDYGLALGLESSNLITALLITQFVGFPAAYFFGKTTHIWGCRKPILFCICVYAITVIAATHMSTSLHFYMLATIIGLVQGGVQSLSRSLFAKMIPKDRSGEFFGFFNLIGKFASIVGPLVVALTVTITQNNRSGMLGLLVLFAVGGFLLFKVKENPQPS